MSFTSLLFLILTPLFTRAQENHAYSNSSIGTCNSVNYCGDNESTQAPFKCTISANHQPQTFMSLGINTFPVPFAPGNWSWTVGYAQNTQVDKYYYLGTNPGYDKGHGPQGWALFFQSIDAQLYGETCSTALPPNCAADLERQAQNVLRKSGNLQGNDMGLALENSFNSSLPSTCNPVADGKALSAHAIQITGPNTPAYEAILNQGPSSCYPTLPQSNDLQFVYTFNQTGLPITANLDRVVGVMTVVNSQPAPFTHLECMAGYLAMNQSVMAHSENAAPMMRTSFFSAAIALLVASGLTIF